MKLTPQELATVQEALHTCFIKAPSQVRPDNVEAKRKEYKELRDKVQAYLLGDKRD